MTACAFWRLKFSPTSVTEVLAAADGEQALHEFDTHQLNIGLHDSRCNVAKAQWPGSLRADQHEKAGYPVIFATGYSADMAMLNRVQDHGLPVLQKPYAPRALARKVREILDQHAAVVERSAETGKN